MTSPVLHVAQSEIDQERSKYPRYRFESDFDAAIALIVVRAVTLDRCHGWEEVFDPEWTRDESALRAIVRLLMGRAVGVLGRAACAREQVTEAVE